MKNRTKMMMYGNMRDRETERYPESRYDRMENRFRDGRGRERYNDGRFAPRNGMDYRNGGGGEPESRSYNRYEPEGHYGTGKHGAPQRTGLIGFVPDEGLNWEMAQEWVEGMENADGTRGPKWHIDQVEQLMQKRGIDCDPVEFWAVMNSLHSDFCQVIKEHGCESVELYLDLAKAWLEDEDAVEDKAKMYFEYIVR